MPFGERVMAAPTSWRSLEDSKIWGFVSGGDGRGGRRRDTVTLCPACFRAVAAVRPAIPAPRIRMLSCKGVFEPILAMSESLQNVSDKKEYVETRRNLQGLYKFLDEKSK